MAALNYTEDEIERDFLPAMALRDELDVAHAKLEYFTIDQLEVAHKWAAHAEEQFRGLIERVMSAAEQGTYKVAAYTQDPSSKAGAIIERMRQALAKVVESDVSRAASTARSVTAQPSDRGSEPNSKSDPK